MHRILIEPHLLINFVYLSHTLCLSPRPHIDDFLTFIIDVSPRKRSDIVHWLVVLEEIQIEEKRAPQSASEAEKVVIRRNFQRVISPDQTRLISWAKPEHWWTQNAEHKNNSD